MKQIRRNIFETNSSSSHSIVLTNDDLDKSNSEYFPYFETYLCNDGIYNISNYENQGRHIWHHQRILQKY